MSEPQKEDKTIPWEEFEMGDSEVEAKKQKFPLIAEGLYEVLCTDLKMVLGKKYQSEETIKQFEWTFELVSNIANPQGGLLDSDGNPLERTSFPVWTQLYQTKIGKDGAPQATRMIMCALLGLPKNAGIDGKVDPKKFIGRSCQAFIEIGLKQDGVTEKNVFKKFTPLQGRKDGGQPVAPQAEGQAQAQPGEPV